jgi:hypothetical protein
MKGKPIIFSTPMVRALLNTRPSIWPAEPIDSGKPYKSMTRRVIKVKQLPGPNTKKKIKADTPGLWLIPLNEKPTPTYSIAPFQKGDILWVRETFTKTKGGGYIYRADPMFNGMGEGDFSWPWTSPLFLPRKAARIFLEVKNVRVERVQEISPEDAEGEGVKPILTCGSKPELKNSVCVQNSCYVCAFKNLWDHLNAKRGYSWDSNPWVWVYEFMRVKCG